MVAHAGNPHPSPAAPPAPEARQIDLVRFGDRRLGVPQQVAWAATLVQRQFGRPPVVVGLSPAAVAPPYPAQIAGGPVRVRAQIPARSHGLVALDRRGGTGAAEQGDERVRDKPN